MKNTKKVYYLLLENKGYYSAKQPNYEWSFTDDIFEAKEFNTINSIKSFIDKNTSTYKEYNRRIIEAEKLIEVNILSETTEIQFKKDTTFKAIKLPDMRFKDKAVTNIKKKAEEDEQYFVEEFSRYKQLCLKYSFKEEINNPVTIFTIYKKNYYYSNKYCMMLMMYTAYKLFENGIYTESKNQIISEIPYLTLIVDSKNIDKAKEIVKSIPDDYLFNENTAYMYSNNVPVRILTYSKNRISLTIENEYYIRLFYNYIRDMLDANSLKITKCDDMFIGIISTSKNINKREKEFLEQVRDLNDFR